jgi:hypothetical protein
MALGFDSGSKRNEYQKYFLGGKGGRYAGLTTLPLSCADCLEIWEPLLPEALGEYPGLKWNSFLLCILFTHSVYLKRSTSFLKYQVIISLNSTKR